MAVSSILLKALFFPLQKTTNENMRADDSYRHRSLSCCVGNIFRKRLPSPSKFYLQAEKPKPSVDAYSSTSETRLPSTFVALSDDPPPIYRASAENFVENTPQVQLTFAPGVESMIGLSRVPREVVQGMMNVPDSLSQRFNKEKDMLQTLWIQNQSRRQPAQNPRALTDRDAVYVYDNKTGTTYRRGRLLGKGGFAKCYELTDVNSNKTYAGKIISKNRLNHPRQMEKIVREVELHSCLRHANVVEFRSFFEDHENVYMVLENCSRKTLVHMLKARKALTEPEVRYYMRQLVEGCRYVHSKKVIHRDLKLGNMLLNDTMQLKIADFGLATRVAYEGEKKMTVCGTPNYIAPEVLQRKGHSYEADIWAMGCIMFALLCGRPPFETMSLKDTYARIAANKFSIPNHVSSEAQALIFKLLHPVPSYRPNLDKILDEPFFTAGVSPSYLPTTCCEVEPKFTTTHHIRPRSYAAPASNNDEMRAIVSSVEQATASKPKRSISQRLPKKENIEPVSELEHPQSFKSLSSQQSNSDSQPKVKTPQSKPLYDWSEKDREKEQTELLDVNLQKKVLRRMALKQRIIEEEAEFAIRSRKPLSFVKKFPEGDVERKILAEKQAALNRNYTVTESDLRCPKQKWISQRNLKEDNVFSACSPFRLFQAISKCLEVMPPDFNPTPIHDCKPLWVTKWVDYSNKYGFGFQLSDKTVGILFNDTTRMIRSSDNKTLVYNDLSNKIVTFTADTAPAEQRKKVTLLLYFIQYMNENLINNEETGKASNSSYLSFSSAVFMKKWFRTDKAVVMYLNNGTLQVNFLADHTKLIIGVDGQDYLVTYIDAERQMLSYRLLQLSHFGCNIQLDERLRYAQRMLESVMNLKGEAV